MNVIIPIDFSDNSKNAALYALKLFEDIACKFYFVHADKTLNNQPELEAKIDAFARAVVELHDDSKHEYVTLVSNNKLVNEIEVLVKEKNTNLIVMGTKGASNSKKTLGSNTLNVINKKLCPVIAVPEGYGFSKVKNILFPTDLYISFKEKHLNSLTFIANKYKANVILFHVVFRGLKTLQKERKLQLEEKLAHIKTKFVLHEFKDVGEAIHDYQENNSTELLMMINNKHSFIESLLFEPVISKIALHLQTPFLVVPA